MMERVMTATCPDLSTIRRFCEGHADDTELELVASHIAECEGCEAKVARVSTTPFAGLAAPLSAELPSDFEFEDIVREVESRLEPVVRPAMKRRRWIPDVPDKLGGYMVIREISNGGMATVYLARDPSVDRLVALKIPYVRENVNASETRQLLLAESRIAAELIHPHIVPVYSFDTFEMRVSGGAPAEHVYQVQQYVSGGTLRHKLEEGRLSVSEAKQIFEDIAGALQHLHDRNLIHRDVKPSNILLDEDGRAHLVDFGLAVHREDIGLHGDELAGTPAYMAPEQLRGENDAVDRRADIWALGAILHEMLTGRAPYPIESLHERADFLRRADELAGTAPPSIRDACPDIPRWIDAICRQALEPDLEKRCATIEAFQAPFRSHRRKRRATAVIMLLGLCLTIGVFASGAIQRFASRDSRDIQPVDKMLAVGTEAYVLVRPYVVPKHDKDFRGDVHIDPDRQSVTGTDVDGRTRRQFGILPTDSFNLEYTAVVPMHNTVGLYWGDDVVLDPAPRHEYEGIIIHQTYPGVDISLRQLGLRDEEGRDWEVTRYVSRCESNTESLYRVYVEIRGRKLTKLTVNNIDHTPNEDFVLTPIKGKPFGVVLTGGFVELQNCVLTPLEDD